MESGLNRQKVTVSAPSGKKSVGEVTIQVWNKSDRSRRALRALGFCWAMSLVTVVLPIVHFILVPGFFIAGPVAAWFISQQKSIVTGGEADCPQCSAKLIIVRSSDRWPLSDLCSNCQTNVTIEKDSI